MYILIFCRSSGWCAGLIGNVPSLSSWFVQLICQIGLQYKLCHAHVDYKFIYCPTIKETTLCTCVEGMGVSGSELIHQEYKLRSPTILTIYCILVGTRAYPIFFHLIITLHVLCTIKHVYIPCLNGGYGVDRVEVYLCVLVWYTYRCGWKMLGTNYDAIANKTPVHAWMSTNSH